ncbi:retrotransposon-related protein [Tanacetum coccineum]
MDQRVTNPAQVMWLPKLMGFDYEIRYKKGIENVVADALSRLSNSGEFLQMVATNLTTDVYQRIVEGWSTDDKLREIVQKLQSSNGTVKHYQWSAQQLLRKGKLVIGEDSQLRQELFKPELVPYPELLQPLPIPEKVWTHILMDFVDGLPMPKGKSVLLVVVDRLSKYGHFIPLTHPYSTINVAQAFLDNVYKLHGLPKVIVSDKDMVFLTPPAHVTYTAGDSVNDSVDRSLMVREAAIQLLKFHLQRAQDRMKTMTDKKRTEEALAKVGEVAYKLELPADSQIHPVFHVSQLKKFRGTVSQRGNVAAVYVLIQWTNEGVDDATWELYDDIAVRFLTFDLNA